MEMIERFEVVLKNKPDYDKLYDEAKGYAIVLKGEPLLDELNKNFSLVQSYRDRVCKMLLDSIRNTRVYERVYETLFDTEIVKREEKSSEQRAANVNNLIRNFYDAYKEAEDYEASLRLVYENLKAANENVSRQVTIVSEQNKLGEIGRVK